VPDNCVPSRVAVIPPSPPGRHDSEKTSGIAAAGPETDPVAAAVGDSDAVHDPEIWPFSSRRTSLNAICPACASVALPTHVPASTLAGSDGAGISSPPQADTSIRTAMSAARTGTDMRITG